MNQLLPIGSVILLKNARKKLMIIGILIFNQNENKSYDYLGVPFPEGYIGTKHHYLFNHEDINDVVFLGYNNPERETFIEALSTHYSKQETNESSI